eukprot:6782264-Prymnesium_polylepis.1
MCLAARSAHDRAEAEGQGRRVAGRQGGGGGRLTRRPKVLAPGGRARLAARQARRAQGAQGGRGRRRALVGAARVARRLLC